jgi:hypothetical protein
MTRTFQEHIGKAVLALAALFCVAGGSGCDELIPDYAYNSLFPQSGLYDPTNDIQSVIGYRQDAMDWSNAGWDDFIRQ